MPMPKREVLHRLVEGGQLERLDERCGTPWRSRTGNTGPCSLPTVSTESSSGNEHVSNYDSDALLELGKAFYGAPSLLRRRSRWRPPSGADEPERGPMVVVLAGAVAADEAHHAAGGHVDVHVLEIEALVSAFRGSV